MLVIQLYFSAPECDMKKKRPGQNAILLIWISAVLLLESTNRITLRQFNRYGLYSEG